MSNETEWVLVPREPTPEMANWFRADEGSATFFTHTTIQCADFGSRYSAMLAAAPQPPAEAQPEPNWCRTCGRRPHDPVAALCPDTHHRKAPPPSAPVGVAADILRIVDTAIDVCNDRDRPAMAEDLEAVRLYVEQASDALAQQPAACPYCGGTKGHWEGCPAPVDKQPAAGAACAPP